MRFEWMTGLVLSSQPGFVRGFGWEDDFGLAWIWRRLYRLSLFSLIGR
jgi:hypothetical protein